MKVSTSLVSLLMITTAFSCAHPWGGKHKGAPMGSQAGMKSSMMSIEAQDKMAKMHGDAASCLRDGKSPDQCHELMMKSHEQMCKEMGNEHCRGMGMMTGGR